MVRGLVSRRKQAEHMYTPTNACIRETKVLKSLPVHCPADQHDIALLGDLASASEVIHERLVVGAIAGSSNGLRR